MPVKGTVDFLFVQKRMEGYREIDQNLHMCFADFKKAFDLKVPRKVGEWAMRRKDIPEMLVKVVMTLYKEKTTKIKVGSG